MALRALSEDALSWVHVETASPDGLATVLPWHPVVALDYDPEADRIDVATADGVHRIDRPLVLFALGNGDLVHRFVAVEFDGGLDLIDVSPEGRTEQDARLRPTA